jgi:hypothetical protein
MDRADLIPAHVERFPRLAALSRTRRRLWRTGLFALETAARTGRGEGGALLASWVAENLAALHGLDVRIAGALPSPALLIVRSDEILAPLAVLARVHALPGLPASLADLPVIGTVIRELGAQLVTGHDGRDEASAAARRALDSGLSVVWAAGAPVPEVDAPVIALDVRRDVDGDRGAIATYVQTATRARTTLVIVPEPLPARRHARRPDA